MGGGVGYRLCAYVCLQIVFNLILYSCEHIVCNLSAIFTVIVIANCISREVSIAGFLP